MDNSTNQDADSLPFLNTNLQQSIVAASLQAKTLLCFVTDNSEASSQWEAVISEQKYRSQLTAQHVTLKIHAGTQEADYLNTVCPLNSIPALVTIKRGSIEENLQHANITATDLRTKFDTNFALVEQANQSDLNGQDTSTSSTQILDDPSTTPSMYLVLPPSAGRMRLPNNAYDALAVQTQKWLDQGIKDDNVLRLQLKLLRNVPALASSVKSIEERPRNTAPELTAEYQDRLLNTPSAALGVDRMATGPNPPRSESSTPHNHNSSTGSVANTSAPSTSASIPRQQQHQQQRTNYIRAQREREAAERAERERIKAQIASDRADRRRADEIRRQSERKAELETLRQANSTTTNPQSTDIRIQVRTFDGSTIKTTFARDSSISTHLRPWIDEQSKQSNPYNLKLILTPLPNKNIEASEEGQTLSELGIIGSATMVMVPVKGYVDSYSGGGSGLVSAVTGAVGGVLGGIGGLIGWGSGPVATTAPTENSNIETQGRSTHEPRARVRTLADQRAEEAKKQGNELYNGNQLNFQGRKDDDVDKKQD